MPNDLPLTFDDIEVDNTYNGWANHATWNVAMHIQNDEGLYRMAKELDCYEQFQDIMAETAMFNPTDGTARMIGIQTTDGVSWTDESLDTEELDEMIKEL